MKITLILHQKRYASNIFTNLSGRYKNDKYRYRNTLNPQVNVNNNVEKSVKLML